MSELNLDLVPSVFHQDIADAFAERDGCGLLAYLNNTEHLDFVFQNMRVLRDVGLYEEALVFAFSSTRTNNAKWNEDVLEFMFRFGDGQRLRNCGAALPSGSTFTIYRGVSGHGRARRIRGFSWTDSLDAACWFALRFGLANPAVFQATVTSDDVLVFIEDRKEREFVLQPEKPTRLKLTVEEIRQRASQWKAAK